MQCLLLMPTTLALIKYCTAAVSPSLNQSNNLALWQAVLVGYRFLNSINTVIAGVHKPVDAFLQAACAAVFRATINVCSSQIVITTKFNR